MTRLFRAIRAVALYPIGERKPISCSEAGRRGAQARNTKERERICAKARWLREQTGQAPDPRLGAC